MEDIRDERPFSIMAVPTDPFVKSLTNEFDLTAEQVKDISESIVSIKVEGKK